MVHITSFVAAIALLSSFASGLPRPQPKDDSAIGIEVAVSAPNGIPLTDSIELSSQSSREAATQTATSVEAKMTQYGSSYGSSPGKEGASWALSSSASYTLTMQAPAATSSSSAAVSTKPSYGSGGSNWGNAQYQDCVQQCVASYSGAPASYTPTATNAGTYGTGATHTVIVAPTQGVLRYIPFAVNASVGDTVKFMWGANNHTVTKSSALLPCNRSGDAVFASGVQNKGFVYTQVVNDTKPTYFFCGTPSHCQKGMFGIINPTTNFAASTSVSLQMREIGANNSDVQGYAAYTTKQTAKSPQAAKWGGNIDMAALPAWSHSFVAENVLYTRNFLAENPEVLKEDGKIDLGSADATPLSIPQDIAAALNNAGSYGGTTASTVAPASASTASPVTTGTAGNLSSSAATVSSSRVLALVVVFATFILL